MATSQLMTGKHIPHFDLNSLISTLSFGEIFSYFATSWKWYCPTFWIGKKSGLFRRFFQYSVICHFSKSIRLALTNFHKNKVFYRKCMWLQLLQVLKKFTEGNARKFTVSIAFLSSCWRYRNRKTLMFSFKRAQITWAFIISVCNGKTIGSHLKLTVSIFNTLPPPPPPTSLLVVPYCLHVNLLQLCFIHQINKVNAF